MTRSKLILHISDKPFRPLEKASNIELFFDLVLIFCMRNIIPVLTEAETLDWYTYYTFGFTFLLMLQLWFHTTLIMNRYGTGDTIDRASLLLIMLLLFIMTHAISTNWENYVGYNLSWVGILLVLIGHWYAKLRTLPRLTDNDRSIMRRTMLVLGLQAAAVLVSTPLPSVPGQIGCAVAVGIGFFGWGASNAYKAKPANFEHLTERCALIVILTFGETLIGLGEMMSFEHGIIYGLGMFVLVATLFMIFLNQYELALNKDCVTSGIFYMAVTVVLVFALANINAAFDFILTGKAFYFNSDLYLAISMALFMLAIMAYTPFNKTRGAMSLRWVAVRFGFTALILLSPFATRDIPYLDGIIAFIAVFGVFLFDRFLYFRLLPIKIKSQKSSEESQPPQS